ncbi:294_t:CDS:2, partial [Gigaspora margarita]
MVTFGRCTLEAIYLDRRIYIKKKVQECGGTINQVIKKRPLSIIEDPELVEILQYLNPMVELVKGDTIKNTIMSLYDGIEEVIIDFGLMSRKLDGTNIANRFFKVLEDYDIISK